MGTELLPNARPPFRRGREHPSTSHSPQRDSAALADEQEGLGELSISKAIQVPTAIHHKHSKQSSASEGDKTALPWQGQPVERPNHAQTRLPQLGIPSFPAIRS